MFVIDDELHAELQPGEFETLEEAIAELQRIAQIPWDEPPNRAPCTSWKKCGRTYEILEYDDPDRPNKLLRRTPALEISKSGVKWLINRE